MGFKMIWNGIEIPGDVKVPFEARDAIMALEPDPKLAEQLWALWATADATIVGDEYLFVENTIPELLACVELQNEELGDAEPDHREVFLSLPDFIRENYPDRLDIRVTA